MSASIEKIACLSGFTLLAFAGIAESAPILALDFQGFYQSTPTTETGFSAFDNGDGPGLGGSYSSTSLTNTYSTGGVTSGTITVGLASVNGSRELTQGYADRDRTTGAGTDGTPAGYTYAELYRDFIFIQNGSYGTTGNVNGMDIFITGLNPNAQYAIDTYSEDTGTPGEIYSFRNVTSYGVPSTTGATDATSPQNTIGVYATVTSGPTPTSNEEYATGAFTFTSDSSGRIVLNEESSSGYEEIDGMTISAVPEPASAALLGLGLPLLMRRRRIAAPISRHKDSVL